MATVYFSSELQRLTGEVECRVSALDYRSLIDELVSRYENLDKPLLMEMAVSIDDFILVEPLLETISSDAEVHFFHFVKGG